MPKRGGRIEEEILVMTERREREGKFNTKERKIGKEEILLMLERRKREGKFNTRERKKEKEEIMFN